MKIPWLIIALIIGYYLVIIQKGKTKKQLERYDHTKATANESLHKDRR